MPAGFRSINYHKLQEHYIPYGKNKNNGLQLFKRTLKDIGTTTRVLLPPYQILDFHFHVLYLCSKMVSFEGNKQMHFLFCNNNKFIFCQNGL